MYSLLMATENLISDIVEKITRFYNPDKVILFGSYAYGNTDLDSDLDLILIKETTQPKHKRTVEIYKQLMGTKFPVDILVYTPEEYEKALTDKYSFLSSAIKKSKLLYERK